MSSLFSIGGGGNVGASGSFYSYSIDQSLRFNKDDSAYLSRTPSSAGNRDTWTISMWVKRSRLGLTQSKLFGAGSSFPSNHNNAFYMWFQSDDTLRMRNESGGSYFTRLDTTRRFRDVSSWYHIVYVYDSTQATATDRQKLYINGVEETAFDERTDPNLNVDSQVNGTFQHNIGVTTPVNYFDGYMAEVNFIDGTALDATSFGETSNGVWVPKAYSGSYGTNGFYLSFADSAAIGDDLSGNTNDWTANNLAAIDVVTDSPTNNFATLSTVDNAQGATISEGNLRAANASGTDKRYHSTFGMTTGKWYWEVRVNTAGTRNQIGVFSDDNTAGTSLPTNYAYIGVGNSSGATSGTFNGTKFTASNGDIVTFAFDADNGNLYYGQNSAPTIGATADISGLASDTYLFGCREPSTSPGNNTLNFGQDSTFAGATTAGGNADGNGYGDFKYSVPSGFLALNSANLPEPAIGPNSTTTSDEHFNTVLYTGTGASNSITVGFQPDFTWIKRRDATADHQLVNSVVGYPDGTLLSNQTDAEYTAAARVDSRDSNGFTVSTPTQVNASGGTYASWNWKAGGTAVSNSDGSITSNVSANQDAGFSIVSYTGTGANATVGHGLSSAPEMVIIKSRSSALDWPVGHTSIGFGNYLKLNTTAAQTSAAAVFNSTAPTASVFSIGTNTQTNASSGNYIAYCFHSVEGHLKCGSYVGNGSADGTYVALGFRPAWIMTKRTDSTSNWLIIDVKRDIDNVAHNRLIANSTNTEATSVVATMDILSNGFKRRDTNTDVNASGGSYIYLAFAEEPFKYANAR